MDKYVLPAASYNEMNTERIHAKRFTRAYDTRYFQLVLETPDDIRFAFQPLINLYTGDVVAMEMLARPCTVMCGRCCAAPLMQESWRSST